MDTQPEMQPEVWATRPSPVPPRPQREDRTSERWKASPVMTGVTVRAGGVVALCACVGGGELNVLPSSAATESTGTNLKETKPRGPGRGLASTQAKRTRSGVGAPQASRAHCPQAPSRFELA